ncbi:MAG TPA: Ig-like domain-containing protein, partial [Burkholderiaceae bacterium]
VKNNNTAACGSSSISLAQVLPAGFGGSVPASLSVAAGATASTSWTVTPSTSVGAGSHGIDLRAADTSGATTTAHGTYAVVVGSTVDSTAPTVSFASPAYGSVLSRSLGSVTIAANAKDSESGIARVDFYVDGVLLATDTSAPYNAVWPLRYVPTGSHTLRVRAFNKVGLSRSAAATVTVN